MNLIDNIRKNSHILDVYVNNKLVGNIKKMLKNDDIVYVFTYNKKAKFNDFVSLIMPVRDKPYEYKGRLHPIFQQNLPEGVQLNMLLERFGKIVMDEDMVLLGMTGAQSIGRVKVVPHGFDLNWNNLPVVDVNQLTIDKNISITINHLLEICAPIQGVSGQMPKALCNDKIALKTSGFIIKTETDQFKGAMISEALCQQAAANAGLKVAEGMLSEDGSILVSKRFDEDGFEDMCSVAGFNANQKNRGDLRRVLEIIRNVSSNPNEDILSVLKWHIFNMTIGNSEGHMKNLGFVYTTASGKPVTRLAPFYDILSTVSFNHLRNDLPAMTLDGVRTWEIGQEFRKIANDYGVSSKTIDRMINEVNEAMEPLIEDISSAIQHFPKFAECGKNMLEVLGVNPSDINVPSSK